MGSAPTKPKRKDGLVFLSSSDSSSSSDSEDDERPDQVRKFEFTEVSKNTLNLTWKPPKTCEPAKYNLRIFPPEGVRSKTLIKNLEDTSYKFDKLTAGTRYTIGIVLVDESGKRSLCASATESTLPEPPTHLQILDKDVTAVTFKCLWLSSKGNRDFYEIEITPTEGVTGKTSVSNLLDTEYTFTGLVPGTKYTVKVVSVANGRKSEVLESTAITHPGHVYDLTFPSVTHNEIQVVWKPPPGFVETYSIELSNEKELTEPIKIRKINATNYTFNGLITGRKYCCTIYTHAHGKTSLRKEFDQCTVPSEPTNLAVGKVTAEEAVINWSRGPGDVDDYDLFLTPKEGMTGEPCPRGVQGNNYTFKGLIPGTKYSVGVLSNSQDKTSQRVVTGFMTEPAPCGEISFPENAKKSDELLVTWQPARGGVDSYSIVTLREGGSGGSSKRDEITESQCLFTDLTPGSEYTFNISTVTEGRQSKASTAVCSTLPCPAGKISFPEGGITSTEIKFAWEPSAGGVDVYRVNASGGGTELEEQYIYYDQNEYTLTNLLPGTKYDISVMVNSNGIDSEPSTASATTGPAGVANFSSKTLSKNELKVTWSAPSGAVDDYDLTIRPTDGCDGETDPRGVQETEYVFKHLVPGTLYTITVVANSRDIPGPVSETKGYTLPGDILNVHFPGDTVTHDSMKVVWGVEGNSTDVLLTLLRAGTTEGDGDIFVMETTVKSASQFLFEDLKKDTTHRVMLQTLASSELAAAGGDKTKGETTVVEQRTEKKKRKGTASSSSSSSDDD